MEHFYSEAVTLAIHEIQELIDGCHWWDFSNKKSYRKIIVFLEHVNQLDDENHAVNDIGRFVCYVMACNLTNLEPVLRQLVPPIAGMEIDLGEYHAD